MEESSWCGRVPDSAFFRGNRIDGFNITSSRVLASPPASFEKIFEFHVRFLNRLLCDLREHNVTTWYKKYNAIERVKSDSDLTALVCMERLDTRRSLWDLENGPQVGKEAICICMMHLLHEIKRK